jgi:hypothetical protein
MFDVGMIRNGSVLIVYSLSDLEPVNHGRLTSPLRSSTPVFNGNGNTRPTSPISSSPLRHTVAITNYPNSTIRSRDVSREREREPLDYTDLEGNRSLTRESTL